MLAKFQETFNTKNLSRFMIDTWVVSKRLPNTTFRKNPIELRNY